jgi:hypothetical protein
MARRVALTVSALVALGAFALTLSASGDPAKRLPSKPALSRGEHRSVTIDFAAGEQHRAFTMAEPKGVIRLYRVAVPEGTMLRGTAQLPKVTVPLQIVTHPNKWNSSCSTSGSRVTCTASEEACPMPKGAWSFHLDKLAGPAGTVKLTFRVGPSRSS